MDKNGLYTLENSLYRPPATSLRRAWERGVLRLA